MEEAKAAFQFQGLTRIALQRDARVPPRLTGRDRGIIGVPNGYRTPMLWDWLAREFQGESKEALVRDQQPVARRNEQNPANITPSPMDNGWIGERTCR